MANRRFDELDSLRWPSLEGRTATYGMVTACVLLAVGVAFAVSGAGIEPIAAMLFLGLFTAAANIVRLWGLPTRRFDSDAGEFEFETPIGSGPEGRMDLDEFERFEVAHRNVRRRRQSNYGYWEVRGGVGANLHRLESGNYGELHRLIQLADALAERADAECDIGVEVVEPRTIDGEVETSWWVVPDPRVLMLLLVSASSILGLFYAAAIGGVPVVSLPVFFVVIGLVVVGGIYKYGRYRYPDQVGCHGLVIAPGEGVVSTSNNPAVGRRRYEVDDLDAIAVHSGRDPAVFFLEEDATRFTALDDEGRAAELAREIDDAVTETETPAADTKSAKSVEW